MISSPFIYFCLSVFDFLFLFFFFLLNFWLESSPIHEAILKRHCFIIKLGKRCPVSIFFFLVCVFFLLSMSPSSSQHGGRKPITLVSFSTAGSPSRCSAEGRGQPSSVPSSLCLGGSGGGGSSPTGRGYCEERVLDGLSRGGGGMKAGCGCGVPCGGCGGRNQAYWVAGEQREVLRIQEQRGSHDVWGSSRIGKYQVPSCIQ